MPQVTMLLVNAPGQPTGSIEDRLVVNLALTRNGELDPAAYDADPMPWTAVRQTPDGGRTTGELIRFDDGWALRGEAGEDSPLWPVTARIFRPGEYVTVRTAHQADLLYQIVAVEAPELTQG